jgi:hypothetical protein
MATKTKAPHSSRQTKGSSAAGNRRESVFMDESTAIDQIVDEIPGTIEDVTPDDHTSESSGPPTCEQSCTTCDGKLDVCRH